MPKQVWFTPSFKGKQQLWKNWSNINAEGYKCESCGIIPKTISELLEDRDNCYRCFMRINSFWTEESDDYILKEGEWEEKDEKTFT